MNQPSLWSDSLLALSQWQRKQSCTTTKMRLWSLRTLQRQDETKYSTPTSSSNWLNKNHDRFFAARLPFFKHSFDFLDTSLCHQRSFPHLGKPSTLSASYVQSHHFLLQNITCLAQGIEVSGIYEFHLAEMHFSEMPYEVEKDPNSGVFTQKNSKPKHNTSLSKSRAGRRYHCWCSPVAW